MSHAAHRAPTARDNPSSRSLSRGALTPTITARTSLLVLLSMIFAMLAPIVASPVQAETTPTITSDKLDYAPGELVTLTGAGWQEGESVHITVDDDQTKSWKRDVDVVADASGTITDSFNLPDWFVATYKVTATGAISGTATYIFTDGNIRFITNGVTTGNVTATTYNTTNCTGSGTPGTPAQMTSNAGGTLTAGAIATQSVQLTAPATAGSPAQSFSSWAAKNGTDPFTTSADGRIICVPGFANGNRDYQANYSTVASTALSAVSGSAAFGGPATLTATLKAGSTVVPGKTVTFSIGSAVVGSASTDATGVATASNVDLGGRAAGTYTLTASFAGDASFGASTATGNLVVGSAVTTVSAVSGSAAFGGPATLTATLKAGSAVVPGKTVTFSVGGAVVGSASTDATGVATASNVDLGGRAAGTYTLTASFAGDASFGASTATGNLVVGSAVTTVSAVSGSATFGGTATLSATLKAGATALSGQTVQFKLGTDVVGTATTNSSGVATLTGVDVTGRDAGTYTDLITATFAAAGNYAGSTATGNLVVGQAASTVSAVSGSATFGGTATLNATLKAGATALSGQTVQFKVGTDVVGTATTNSSGVATLTGVDVTGRDAGTYTDLITATFAAAGNYAGSTATGDLTVGQAASTVSAVSGTGTYGRTATLTATVKAGSTPLAGRTVTFEILGTSVGTSTTNSSGVATLTQVDLGTRAAGTYTDLITASAAAGGNYAAHSATGDLTVGKRAITVTADDQDQDLRRQPTRR